MPIGITFPTETIGSDPVAMRDFAQTAEGAGFDYLSVIEHVSGAAASRFEGVDVPGFGTPPYLYDIQFHEPFCLFSYLSAFTTRMQLFTGILVLPQRQTVLVAKQAAEVDILSQGRLNIGIGIGWNHAEFESLGADFHNRGRRVEEQIEVLRRLWREPLVDYAGRWHTLDQVGINPLPGRMIPIWMGGGQSEAVMRRIARYADGWMPNLGAGNPADLINRMRRYLEEAGRDPNSLPVESGINLTQDRDTWLPRVKQLRSFGIANLRLGYGGPNTPAAKGLRLALDAKQLLEEELAKGA